MPQNTNQVHREPRVRFSEMLIPPSTLLEDTTTDPFDFGSLHQRNHMLLLAIGADIVSDNVIISIEESDYPSTGFKQIGQFEVVKAELMSQRLPITRTRRYIRAVVKMEYATVEDISVPITLILLY